MVRDDLEAKLLDYARGLSPTAEERSFVSAVYQSVKDLLGENNCLQIGSFPRFTSIRPLHDLDILFLLGEWGGDNPDPSEALESAYRLIRDGYENPSNYRIEVGIQSHSVSMSFLDHDEEIFAVDILPAYSYAKNEFDQDMYRVPQVLKVKSPAKRKEFYKQLQEQYQYMQWIETDPRGYIEIASEIDTRSTGKFRKAAKLVKNWAKNLSEVDEELKLRSFHLEQAVTERFVANPSLAIVDCLYELFINLPELISPPCKFPDRANPDNFIDDYIEDFSDQQIGKINAARDGLLRKLEFISPSMSMRDLFTIEFYYRKPAEEFLFDASIKTFTDPNLVFEIDGCVKPLAGFSSGWLRTTPALKKGLTRGPNSQRKIEFKVTKNNTRADEIHFKVRNCDDCEEPRGEITVGRTRNVPERTKYVGKHYVEGYAIRDGSCIARSKINVLII